MKIRLGVMTVASGVALAGTAQAAVEKVAQQNEGTGVFSEFAVTDGCIHRIVRVGNGDSLMHDAGQAAQYFSASYLYVMVEDHCTPGFVTRTVVSEQMDAPALFDKKLEGASTHVAGEFAASYCTLPEGAVGSPGAVCGDTSIDVDITVTWTPNSPIVESKGHSSDQAGDYVGRSNYVGLERTMLANVAGTVDGVDYAAQDPDSRVYYERYTVSYVIHP